MNPKRLGSRLSGISIRARLLLLVLAMALPALGGVLWYAEHEVSQIRNSVYAGMNVIARETATDIDLILREREAVMKRMAARPLVKALDPKHCDPIMREYATLQREYTTIGVRDAKGNIVCSLIAKPPSQAAIITFPWFQEGLRSGKFTASDAFRGKTSGRWLTILTYPIRNDAGQVSGLLVLSMDLLKLNQELFRRSQKNIVIPVFDRKNRFLLRSIDPESWIGKPLPKENAEIVEGLREGVLSAPDLNGVARLYAATTIQRTGWRVFVGLPEEPAIAPARATLRRSLAIAVALFSIALVLAWRIASAIVKPVQDLADTATKIANGDISARADISGPYEINTVAQEVNHMLDVRERVGDALRASEEKFRSLFATMLEGAALHELVFDESGTPVDYVLLDVNPAFESILGLSRDLVTGRKATEAYGVDTAPYLDVYAQVAISRQPARFETSFEPMRKSFAISAFSPAKNQFATVFEDITERKAIDRELRDSQQKLLQAQYIAKLGDFEWHIATGQVAWSNGMYRLLGYDLAEKVDLGSVNSLVHHPDDLERVTKWLQDAIASDRTQLDPNEYRLVRKDGSVIDVQTNGWIVRENGRAIKLFGTCIDITERKQAEGRLRESESMLRQAQTVGRVGSYVFDIGRDAWTSSEMLNTIFGIASDGSHSAAFWTQIVHPDEREQMATYLKTIIAEHAPFDKEYRILRANDGAERWVWGLGKVEYDTDGTPLRMLGSIQDITERKQADKEKAELETRIQQAQKLDSIGRLAGGVAHDFNNMLTVILGNAATAIERTGPTEPIYADLVEIRKAATRSADLTRQLLAFARKQVIAPKILNLNETVSGIINMLQRLIGENIHLEWLPEANLWPAKVDPSQLDLILANLCINARDAIAGVGNIAIETGNSTFDEEYCAAHPDFLPGEYVRISVSDNGHGIDKEALAHIFEPFFTTKNTGEGTGLGLATVYGAVKQSNGFINAYSEPHRGTTFTIYFPRYEGQVEAEASTEAAVAPIRGRETVLLVEDEPSILKLTERILARQGYSVVTATAPGEAIRLATAHAGAIHLLITDVVMPEMNGRDLAKELKLLCPSLKILFMSGYTANIIVHQGVLDQGVQFIQKPFAVDDLAAKVREVLDFD